MNSRRGFIGLATLLLLVRPALTWCGCSPLALPGWYEHILVPILLLLTVASTVSRNVLMAFLFAGAVLFFAGQSLLLGPAARFLLFWFAIEWLAPEARPFVRATAFLLIPTASSKIFGEPLCFFLLAPLILVMLRAAWHSMGIRHLHDDPEPENTLTIRPERDALLGFFLGLSLVSVPQGVPSTDALPMRPIVFDEAHESLESSRSNSPRRNGHQEFFARLRGATHLETPLSQGFPSDSLLITILPTISYSAGEVALISSHVRSGGAFLAILDHSDMAGASSRLAPLLARFGILPESDTVPWPGQQALGTGFSGALGPSRGRPGTGGTLSPPRFWWPWFLCSAGPHPLVWLENGIRPLRNDGTPSGKCGPQWLGAWGRSGLGTWAVLADSSWLQNGQLIQNHEFARSLLGLLHHPPEPFPYPGLLIFVLFLLPFSLWRFARSRRGHPVLILFLLLGGALGQTWISRAFSETDQFISKGPTANLLIGSNARSALTSDRPQTFEQNLDSFLEEVGNAGWTVQTISDSTIPGNAPLWIVPPHDALPSRALRQRIHEQVEQGASLILLTDPENPESIAMLEEFGFQIASFGSFRPACATNALGLPDRLASLPVLIHPTADPLLASWATPLWCDHPVPLSGGDPLFRDSHGRPIISARHLRSGRIIALADPFFFTNRALEIQGQLEDPEKKKFIRHFLSSLKAGVYR